MREIIHTAIEIFSVSAGVFAIWAIVSTIIEALEK